MSHQDRFISVLRRRLSDAENDLMDNLLAGRVDRRGFLAHGSRLGLSLPLLGGIAGMMGLTAAPRPARAAGPSGGTLRVAATLPPEPSTRSPSPIRAASSCWSKPENF
jgi:peptide/nickel transport system substrate-binding protein